MAEKVILIDDYYLDVMAEIKKYFGIESDTHCIHECLALTERVIEGLRGGYTPGFESDCEFAFSLSLPSPESDKLGGYK